MRTKRVFDIVLSGLILFLILPLFPILAFLIKRGSEGPVFYIQTRIGRGGDEFYMLKFRSMRSDADQIGGHSTMRDDPRITKIGKFIRRTSLDELPQVFNVLKGDMSLVGPRPAVPAQRQNYSQNEWQKRHSVRPGITGLAQATVRLNAPPWRANLA